MNSDSISSPPALALVSDSRLREEVRRIAAAADRRLDERVAPLGRHPWLAASVVVLDAESARCCASAGHPRRDGILLVTDGKPGLLDWQCATEIGAEQVVSLPTAADTLIMAFATHDRRGQEHGAVIAVAGAVGGAGASTMAAAIALTAASRSRDRTLLVDAAPYGGGLDLLLGAESTPGLRWPDLTIEDGRVAAPALHDALPSVAGVGLLSCGRRCTATELAPSAVRSIVEAGRSAGDLVVCDLSTERSPHADLILESADLAVLVVPARLRAAAAAESVAAHLTARNPNVQLIVRGPSPGGLRGADLATAVGLPLLAAMTSQPYLAERLERGGLTIRRRSPLHAAATAVLDALGRDAVHPRGAPAPASSLPTRRTASEAPIGLQS
ncbi:septum site-determining protein Ssd [Nocardia jejuensis]|uniref:septum site-determining protein Ssd n=1 Tax=Nocardia jejuensis TaxID=328049 RepID=UPI0008366D3E|nr:septum site-determining protein Ssd [Nocardia jejuensis]